MNELVGLRQRVRRTDGKMDDDALAMLICAVNRQNVRIFQTNCGDDGSDGGNSKSSRNEGEPATSTAAAAAGTVDRLQRKRRRAYGDCSRGSRSCCSSGENVESRHSNLRVQYMSRIPVFLRREEGRVANERPPRVEEERTKRESLTMMGIEPMIS